MDFPNTGILDNFNRANEGPPPSSSWTTGWATTVGGLSVVSNVCKSASTSGDGYWNVSTFGPDSEVFCTDTVATTIELGIRLTNPSGSGTTNGYSWSSDNNIGNGVYRLDNGVETRLGSINNTNTANNDIIGFRMVGSKLETFINNSLVMSRYDSTYTTAGYIGLYLTNATCQVDDFGGGTVVGVIDPGFSTFPKKRMRNLERVVRSNA